MANIGHFFGAIKLAGFRDITAPFEDFDGLVKGVKSCSVKSSVDEILIPGELGVKAKEYHQKKGISVQLAVLQKLRQIGKDLRMTILF